MHIAKIIASGFPSLQDNTILDFTMKTATKKPDHDLELKQVSIYQYMPICHLFFGGKEEGKEGVLHLLWFCYQILLEGKIPSLKSSLSNEIYLQIYFHEAERIYFYRCKIGQKENSEVFLFQELFCKTAHSKREAHHLQGRYKRITIPKLRFATMSIIPVILSMRHAFYICNSHLSKLQLVQRVYYLYSKLDVSVKSKILQLCAMPFTSMFYDGKGHFLLSYPNCKKIQTIFQVLELFSYENLECLHMLISAYLALEQGATLILSSLDTVPLCVAYHIIHLFLDKQINRHGAGLISFTNHYAFADVFHRDDSIYLLMKENEKYAVHCYCDDFQNMRTMKSKVLENDTKLYPLDLKLLNELRTMLLHKIRA